MFNQSLAKKITSIILFIIFIYMIFQFKVFFVAGELYIEELNQENYIFTEKEIYQLTGTASNMKNIYLNQEEIFLDTKGGFKKDLYLYNGLNTFIFETLSKTEATGKKKFYIFKKKKRTEESKV